MALGDFVRGLVTATGMMTSMILIAWLYQTWVGDDDCQNTYILKPAVEVRGVQTIQIPIDKSQWERVK
jgi:hypothetical protein